MSICRTAKAPTGAEAKNKEMMVASSGFMLRCVSRRTWWVGLTRCPKQGTPRVLVHYCEFLDELKLCD